MITKEAIHFAFHEMDIEVDNIPLAEIISVSAVTETEVECSSLRIKDLEDGEQILRIMTEQGGHNSGVHLLPSRSF